jgi:YtkA-like
MMMQHACPVENPDEEAINGVFPGALAFVMPTSTGGSWTLAMRVHNHKNYKYGVASFNITVDNPTTPVMSVFTSQSVDSSKLVLSIISPTAPKVGMNDIEFTLHRKVSDMSWPADSTYGFVITPEMPSMGHGSPNNVNPVHIGNGHYKGKVNFTMTGEWKINVDVQKDGKTISKDANFIINL